MARTITAELKQLNKMNIEIVSMLKAIDLMKEELEQALRDIHYIAMEKEGNRRIAELKRKNRKEQANEFYATKQAEER